MILGIHSPPVALQLVSFALLLVATITVPVTSSLSLAQQGQIRYGVLGYCVQKIGSNSWACSKASASYNVSSVTTASDWLFSSSSRETLARILVVIPVACFVALVSFVTALLTHFVRSRMMLVIQLCVTTAAFVTAALVCIVVFLLFYPHVTYGSWILIPAAVWPLVSMVCVILALVMGEGNSNDDEEAEEVNRITIGKIDDDASPFDLPDPVTFGGAAAEKQGTGFRTTTQSITEGSYDEKSSSNAYASAQNYGTAAPASNFASSAAHSAPYNASQGAPAPNNAPHSAPQPPPHTAPYPTAYPTADEFNFTPVPQPGFHDNISSDSYHSARNDFEHAPPPANGASGEQSRMASSVYPQDAQYYMEEDNYTRPDDEFEGLDTNSDFTSVSQRPTNPLYYQNGAPQGGPAQNYAAQPQNYGAPPPQNYQGGPGGYGPPPGGYGPPPGGYGPPPGGYGPPQGGYAPPPRSRPKGPSKSDLILNSNPEFSLGGSARPKPGFKRPARGPPRKPGQNKAFMAPASLSGDSPYNLR